MRVRGTSPPGPGPEGSPAARGAAAVVRARPDARIRARIVERAPLFYADGPSAALDRPAHVRAGSALAWVEVSSGRDKGRRLAVVQDDASFVALVDPATKRTSSIPLPRGEGGLRQFDAGRGNKAQKLDLEACVAVDEGGRQTLYAFGSGSTDRRERVAVVELSGGAPRTRLVDAGPLYAALRARPELSAVELNLEGAVIDGERLLLVQRGNGATTGGAPPVDAVIALPWREVRAFLEDPARAPCPSIASVTRYELGSVDGVRLTFTDAAASRGRVVYLAAAEDTDNAYDDGRVVGAAIGVLGEAGARQGPLLDETGAPFTGKPEGLCVDPDDPTRAWIVVDADDPARPAELLTIELSLS